MPVDPLERLLLPAEPVPPRPEFAEELEARLRRDLAPLLVALPETERQELMVTETTMPAVTPSLNYHDAHAAIAWLTEVFGFRTTALFEDPDGSVAFANLEWRGGAIHLSTRHEHGRMPETGEASIVLTAEDAAAVDQLYERAQAAGAEILVPLEDTFYGNHGFSVRDPEGNLWNVGTPWLDTEAARRLPQRRL